MEAAEDGLKRLQVPACIPHTMMVGELQPPSLIIYAVLMQMRSEKKSPKLTDVKSEVTDSSQPGLRCFIFSPSSDQIEFNIEIKLKTKEHYLLSHARE